MEKMVRKVSYFVKGKSPKLFFTIKLIFVDNQLVIGN
jgi:hypothetical protein